MAIQTVVELGREEEERIALQMVADSQRGEAECHAEQTGFDPDGVPIT